jgi:hypothetical protein
MHRELEQPAPFMGGKVNLVLSTEMPEGEAYDSVFQSIFECASAELLNSGPMVVQSFAKAFGEPGGTSEAQRVTELSIGDNTVTLTVGFTLNDVSVDGDVVINALCAKIVATTLGIAAMLLYSRQLGTAVEAAGYVDKAREQILSRARGVFGERDYPDNGAGDHWSDVLLRHHPGFADAPLH